MTRRPQLAAVIGFLAGMSVALPLPAGSEHLRQAVNHTSGPTVKSTGRRHLFAVPTPTPRPSRSATRTAAPTRPSAAPTVAAPREARPPRKTATPRPSSAPSPRKPIADGRRSRRTPTTEKQSSKKVVAQVRDGRSLGIYDVTGYCLNGTMANGQRVQPGAIATLSRRIKFGTRLRIAGRIYTVMDRIGHSSDFDIWFDDCDDAIQWGRRRLEVVVLP